MDLITRTVLRFGIELNWKKRSFLILLSRRCSQCQISEIHSICLGQIDWAESLFRQRRIARVGHHPPAVTNQWGNVDQIENNLITEKRRRETVVRFFPR